MDRRVRTVFTTGAALVMLLAPVYGGQSAQEKGLEIARKADELYSGFGDFSANLRMILRNSQGQTSERLLRVRALEVDDGTRSLCIFDSPPDVKGTILLTHTHERADDDQWLYLPALKRVKRIAAQNKSGSFMGSEFAYEDIARQAVEKFDYRWLRDEECEGQECFVIERRAQDQDYSGYAREVVWLDKQKYRMLRVDYYDRKDSLFKTLTCKDFRCHKDRFWRAREMNMVNHQTGKSSQLIWFDFVFGAGLSENQFDRYSLTRIR